MIYKLIISWFVWWMLALPGGAKAQNHENQH